MITFPRRLARVIPPISRRRFFFAAYVAMGLVLVGLWVSAQVDPLIAVGAANSLRAPLQHLIWDPLIVHGFSLLIVGTVLYRLCRREQFGQFASLVTAASIPLIIVGAAYLIASEILKPSLGYGRPEGYSPEREAPLTAMWRILGGVSGGFPSGYVLRQTVLCMFTLWLLDHPESRSMLSRTERRFVFWTSVSSVVVVAATRVGVGAHNLFDVVAGSAAGIIVFWVIVVPLSGVLYEKSAELVGDVANAWLVFSVAVFFYSYDPHGWVTAASSGYFLLVACALVLRWYWRKALAPVSIGVTSKSEIDQSANVKIRRIRTEARRPSSRR